MSKYTTGEIAKLCGVSVRTVQYYDERRLLIPSELSEGGRRLYSEDDLRRMRIICFLREIDIPINSIINLFSEEHPEKAVSLLLEQQEQILQQEIDECQAKLETLEGIRKGVRELDRFSVESIGDIAHIMKDKQNMKRLHITLLLTGLPNAVFQWVSIILWITRGLWWLLPIQLAVSIPYAVCISRYYLKRVAYICPNCHETFKPVFREAFWANHTPTLRKLTCPHCRQKSFCVEIYHKKTEGEQK